MWSATLQKLVTPDGTPSVKINYLESVTNETAFEQFDVTPLVTPDFLAQKAKNKITFLTARDALVPTLVEGPITPADLPVITPPVLTPAQIAQNQFVQDYQLWVKVKHAIDVGILTGNEVPVVNLKNKVQSEFLPSYLNLL